MTKITRTFEILVCEAHLLGKIRKCMRLLDKSGKYFYIKHYKNDVAPHYHIFYLSNNVTTADKVRRLFESFVTTKAYVNEYRFSDKEACIDYMLGYNKYKRKEIVSTMSLK